MHPYEIEPIDIARLSPADFARVLNVLLLERGRRLSLPLSDVRTTGNLTAADAGVDALTMTLTITDRFLGEGETVWQFKAESQWKESRINNELRKPGVKAGFERGAGYALAIKIDMVPDGLRGHRTREERLQQLAREAGCRGPVRLLTASQIADWASEVPAIVVKLRPQLADFRRVADILSLDRRHASLFVNDDARSQIAQEVMEQLFSSATTANVVSIAA